MEAFFFATEPDLQLFGVARGPRDATRAWILCPPFAEEEKSSRRLLTLLAQMLEARGEASLVFSFRGTGDSQGDFVYATLTAWKRDLAAAHAEAKSRFPNAEIAWLGVRLGGALAWQQASDFEAKHLILIEPLVSGRSFLMQQNAKKQIRAQMTREGAKPTNSNSSMEDLDGWELSQALKSELSALDLRKETPQFSGSTTLFQISSKTEIVPPFQALCDAGGAKARAVVMPSFWNLIDAPDFSPLIGAGQSEIDHD